jgi:UDP-N-acetylmuramoyl-L-alanyl-D-glutamate--2,6-diaminopimelate ligase
MRLENSKLEHLEQAVLVDLLKCSALEIDYKFLALKNIKINNVCADSRKTQPGDFFIAIPCPQVLYNTKEAIQKGACVVLATADVIASFADQVVFIEYPNPRLALSLLAKAFFKIQPDVLMAVTGTNGKSSVVSIVRQLWELLGYPAASFGTVGLETKNHISNLPSIPALTTYDSLSFFSLLKNLSEANINHVIFEASSHGLDQFRIHGSQIAVAGFTNLTQDHLDYHKTMENYFQAKTKLFTEIMSPGKIGVLNASSPYFERLKSLASQRNTQIITYAINAPADLRATKIKVKATNIAFDLEYNGNTYHDIVLNLSGTFQVENTLCAIGMLIASGTTITEIIAIIPKLKPIMGRMELIGKTSNGGHVYVDYAHSPDALDRALKSLRHHTKNNVWVVFGCGGDRDIIKRPLMGKIASSLADRVIVTDDNPRSENPASIRQQILSECTSKAHEIADRRQAIAYAIAHLEKGDTLLIAGKGHETGQIVGSKTYSFSDKQEAEELLTRLKL